MTLKGEFKGFVNSLKQLHLRESKIISNFVS